MKRKSIILALAAITAMPGLVLAGNEDRAGQAGASALLMNPWARSSGWGSAGTSVATGLEATYLNPSGLAFTRRTEVMFARTSWLSGSGVNLNAFGFSQKVGETGVLGMSVMSVDFGEIDVTTTNLPEGGAGTYRPSNLVIGLSYAKEFSRSIYAGITLRAISESIADANAQGIAIDAGIKYVAGEKDNIKFGIALRNVGPPMRFSGEGLSTRAEMPNETSLTVDQRSDKYELPSLLNIGISYDLLPSEDHRVTFAGNFQSNSFTKDQFMLGVEYGFKKYLMLRGGYTYEKGLWDAAQRSTAFTGPSAGLTLQLPINENESVISFDYSYRVTNPFNGTHSIGARVNL